MWPKLLSAFRIISRANGLIPAMPALSFQSPAMMPATNVPWPSWSQGLLSPFEEIPADDVVDIAVLVVVDAVVRRSPSDCARDCPSRCSVIPVEPGVDRWRR